MKQRKKVLLSLLSLVILYSIGMQTSLVVNASSGGRAGITLKKAEEPPTSSTAESTESSQKSPSEEQTLPTSDELPSGKGIVSLPKTGEIAGSGVLIVLGIVLAWFSIRQMKRHRK